MSAKKPKRLQVEYVPVERLLPYARNSRTHTEAQVVEIAASIREFDWTNPVIVRSKDGGKTFDIAAGHARLKAAHKLGIAEVPIIRRDDLSDAQFRAYVIADNRLAEKAGWDFEMLAAEFDDLELDDFDLDIAGFDERERQDVRKRAKRAARDREQGQEGEDEFGTVPMSPITRTGDVWHIGPHRLICGDSLERPTIRTALKASGFGEAAAIVTDPPYAIYGSATGIASDISDDKMVRPFFEKVLGIAKDLLPWFGHAYVFCDWRSWPAIWESCKRVPTIEPKNLIVWDKGGAGLGSNYANTHELIGFFGKLPKQTAMGHRAAGQRTVHKPNVVHHNRPSGDDREHNAAKPVALLRDLVQNSSEEGECILDPFCGSGSTVVACDQVGRVCVTVDIEPGWCDVTIGRMLRLREVEATLGPDGPTYSEIARQRTGDDHGVVKH